MKFKNKTDEIQYKVLGLNEIEVRKRIGLIKKKKVIDKKASREMKNRWRRNKYSLKKGIKKWHSSTQGKRFHRALGRFNALRESISGSLAYYNSELSPGRAFYDISLEQVNDALLSLSSIETHLFLELQYYESDPETQSQFLEILELFIEESSKLKEELLDSFISGEIEKETYNSLLDIIQFFQDPKMYLYSKRETLGLSNDEDSMQEGLDSQKEFIENIDLLEDSRKTFELIDKLFDIEDN